MNVLVVAPHMDDEVLGCGGTIARHVAAGDSVHVVVVANRVYGNTYDAEADARERACTEAARKVLGYQKLSFLGLPDEQLDRGVQDVLIPLEAVYNETQPDVLYGNFPGDNNQDHRGVFGAVRILGRAASRHRARRFLLYETPSSTEQSPPLVDCLFAPNFFVNIENELQQKLDAMACYVTETRLPFPHPRSAEALTVVAKNRGIESGFRAAEAFMVLRDGWA